MQEHLRTLRNLSRHKAEARPNRPKPFTTQRRNTAEHLQTFPNTRQKHIRTHQSLKTQGRCTFQHLETFNHTRRKHLRTLPNPYKHLTEAYQNTPKPLQAQGRSNSEHIKTLKNKRQKHDIQPAKAHSSTTHFANTSHAVQLYYTHISCYFEQLPPILPKLFVSDWHGQCETESWAGKLRVMEMHCLYTSRALTFQATATWNTCHLQNLPKLLDEGSLPGLGNRSAHRTNRLWSELGLQCWRARLLLYQHPFGTRAPGTMLKAILWGCVPPGLEWKECRPHLLFNII